MKTTSGTSSSTNPASKMTNNIVAASNQQRGQKRNLTPEPNTRMLTRKRAALMTTTEKITATAKTINGQGPDSSSMTLPTTPSPPTSPIPQVESNSLNLPPSPTLLASHRPATKWPLEESSTKATKSTRSSSATSALMNRHKRNHPTTKIGMVTRKRASQVSITPRTSIIVKKNSIDPPSSTTLKPDQSPLPAEYSYQLIGISPSPSPDQVTPDTATKNLISTSTVAPLQQASPTTNSKGKAKDTTYQNTLQKPLINYELTRIQQSIGGANLEITDEELLLDGEDPHPELVKLIQEIEKKKEDRIKISMARRDAQLKSHQADFDSIVHKANMEFINGHNNLRKGLYADIFKRRLQLCSEHANSIIPEDSYVTPQRQINPLDQLGTDDYYSLAPSPYDLSYQDVNEDIGAIHTSIALDYAKVSQQNQ